MNATTADLSDDEVEAASLAALSPTGEQLASWTAFSSRVPGGFWRKAAALHRLHDDGSVYLIKVGGRPYLCLGDDADAASAAVATAERRSRPVMVT